MSDTCSVLARMLAAGDVVGDDVAWPSAALDAGVRRDRQGADNRCCLMQNAQCHSTIPSLFLPSLLSASVSRTSESGRIR